MCAFEDNGRCVISCVAIISMYLQASQKLDEEIVAESKVHFVVI
jgi:hypothetical protein